MKTLSLLTALTVQSFLLPLAHLPLAHAANPDQDLIVDLVRERFAASKPATLADLDLGRTWHCVIYSGQRGVMPNYNTIRDNFLFQKGANANQIVNTMDFPYKNFDVTPNSIVGTLGDAQLHVRVAKNSALVFEQIGPQPKQHKAYRSITNPKLRALDYVYCK